MEIHPRRPGASALIDAANDGLLVASSLTGASGSLVAVFRSFMVVHRISRPESRGRSGAGRGEAFASLQLLISLAVPVTSSATLRRPGSFAVGSFVVTMKWMTRAPRGRRRTPSRLRLDGHRTGRNLLRARFVGRLILATQIGHNAMSATTSLF
jgi:hypothetical protein